MNVAMTFYTDAFKYNGHAANRPDHVYRGVFEQIATPETVIKLHEIATKSTQEKPARIELVNPKTGGPIILKLVYFGETWHPRLNECLEFSFTTEEPKIRDRFRVTFLGN